MKSVLKSITKSDWAHRQVCSLIALYIWFVRTTTRWDIDGVAERDRIFASGKPLIIALWHNRIGMMPYAYRQMNHQLTVVASNHRDGRLVLDAMGRFGFDGIPVDSKDGSKATRAIVKCLKGGGWVGITPDGPRGPRSNVKAGIIAIASMANVPIIPVAYSTSRKKTLKTWDLFHLPLPFGKGICRWGDPIFLPEKSSPKIREEYRLYLERTLITLTNQCDQEMGHDPLPLPDVDQGSVPSQPSAL